MEALLTEETMVDEKFKVRIYDKESKQLDVYKIPHDVLSYNFNNVRIIAEKTKKENDLKRELDPTDPTDQKIVEEMLYKSKFYTKTATQDLEQDIKLRGQDEPAIVSIDGTVWNGNRRLAIRRKLLEKTGEQQYEWVRIVRLPPLSGKDLKRLERRLQMHKDWKEEYGAIQTRIDVRNSLDDPDWNDQEIVNSYGGRYKKSDLYKFKREIDLIDEYLQRIGQPYNYAAIKDKVGVESFAALSDSLQKEHAKKTKDVDIQRIKLAGFRLIKNPKCTYKTLRDFDKVLATSQARDEFKKNSVTFTDYPRRRNEFETSDLNAEFDNLDISATTASSAKKDAKKLAKDALKTLQRITNDKIPKNNEDFKNTLEDLAQIIYKLKERSR